MSSTVNKIKDALHIRNDGNKSSTSKTYNNDENFGNTHHSTPEGTYGPHKSRIANAADPSVDSDLDSSQHKSTKASYGHGFNSNNETISGSNTDDSYKSGTGLGRSTGYGSNFKESPLSTGTYEKTGSNQQGSSAAPHDSKFLNKIDPRVDSDANGRVNIHDRAPEGVYNNHEKYASAGSNRTSGATGPHDSDLANRLDPRVDSNLNQSHNLSGNRKYL